MKRLFLIFFSLLLFATIQAQVVSSSTWFALDVGSDYPAVLDDGNTEAWYIAHADYITEDVGVTQWNDVSGNGNHLVQTTDANEPSFSGDSITFDGSNDYMQDAFTNDQPIQMYMVIKQTDWASSDQLIDGNVDFSVYLEQYTSSPNIRANAGANSGLVSFALNTWSIIRVLYNGASSELILNAGTPVTGDFGSDDAAGFTLGSSAFGGYHVGIKVREIIIRSIVDSSGDEIDILNYLNNEYSIY